MAKNSQELIELEEHQRFSESCIWHAQREYYDKKGVEAWSENVPFYITSNPYIAHCYTNLILSFIKDYISLHPSSKKHTFYIVELGAGTGQFGYHVVRNLHRLLELPDFSNLKLCYVMTDFTESNIKFWQKHEALRRYRKEGLLDFAQFDIVNDQSIQLLNSGMSLEKGAVRTPLIVFANYLFDSIINDLFTIKDGDLFRTDVSIATEEENLLDGLPKDWSKVKLNFESSSIETRYYNERRMDALLLHYKNRLKDTHLLFPVGTLRGIENLEEISNNNMLLIASDKGYSELEELDNVDYPELDSHGSFSVMVNFHAISKYLDSPENDTYLPNSHDGLTTAAFMIGKRLKQLPRTQYALEEYVGGFSPVDFFNIYEQLTENLQHCQLNTLASYLALSRWDPALFSHIHDRLIECLNADKVDQEIVSFLINNIKNIIRNYYQIPGSDDLYFEAGLFLQEANCFDEALVYYRRSLRIFGDDYATFYNIGICHFQLKDYKNAKTALEKSLKIKPRSKEAKHLLADTEKALKK